MKKKSKLLFTMTDWRDKKKKVKIAIPRQISRLKVRIRFLEGKQVLLEEENRGLKNQTSHYCDAYMKAVSANFALACQFRNMRAALNTGNDNPVSIPKAVLTWAKKTYANKKK